MIQKCIASQSRFQHVVVKLEQDGAGDKVKHQLLNEKALSKILLLTVTLTWPDCSSVSLVFLFLFNLYLIRKSPEIEISRGPEAFKVLPTNAVQQTDIKAITCYGETINDDSKLIAELLMTA